MPGGRSPLYLTITAMADARRRGPEYIACIIELLQLLVKQGAILQDSTSLQRKACRQPLTSGTLRALVNFDHSHEFIVDLFRAGAGFQLLASCCNEVVRYRWQAKSIVFLRRPS